MRRLCVFCGSRSGSNPIYLEAATAFGALLAERGIELVYGGAGIGLMGAVADGALARGGHVIGVIPKALTRREVVHHGLPDLRVVGSMHERKSLMAELSDGFVALPGVIGTLEELFEIWTWSQLGLHEKPCGLLDVGGFYTGLATFMDHVVMEGFLKPVHRAALIVERDATQLLTRMSTYRPASGTTQWIEPSDS